MASEADALRSEVARLKAANAALMEAVRDAPCSVNCAAHVKVEMPLFGKGAFQHTYDPDRCNCWKARALAEALSGAGTGVQAEGPKEIQAIAPPAHTPALRNARDTYVASEGDTDRLMDLLQEVDLFLDDTPSDAPEGAQE